MNCWRGLQVGLALVWLIYQIVILWVPLLPYAQRFTHLALALAVLTLGLWDSSSTNPNKPFRKFHWLGRATLSLSWIWCVSYFFYSLSRLNDRMEGVDPLATADLWFALILILILLEWVRRLVGWSLLGVLVVFLIFGFIGKWIPSWTQWIWMPEMLKYSGFSASEAAENFVLTPNGLLGVTTSTSVNFVFYFVLFGAVYSALGGGQFFIDIGLRIARGRPGGAPKAAIVASGMMGSISGSAVANVATTGLFTIPMMRKAGYSPAYAAATEAIASTGGQIMPPVMGISAFVMAEFLQESYGRIALAGLIPALTFYVALFFAADLRARRQVLHHSEGEIQETPATIRSRLHLLIPPLALVAWLLYGWSASLSAVAATGVCLVMSLAFRGLRKDLKAWAEALCQGTRQAAEVAIPIAAIGLMIEVIVQSNLALKFSILLMEFSGARVVLALVWVVVGCVVMGLGLPTVAAYIIGAVLFVPPLKDLGIPEVAAHFFVMYYCVLSMVTPPVALASFTAAGLAGANALSTSLLAFRMGAVAFLIPFAFVFNPSLLLEGSILEILGSVLALGLGTMGWVVALEGFWKRRLIPWERICLSMVSFGLLLAPVWVTWMGLHWGINRWPARGMVWSFLGLILAAFFLRFYRSEEVCSEKNDKP